MSRAGGGGGGCGGLASRARSQTFPLKKNCFPLCFIVLCTDLWLNSSVKCPRSSHRSVKWPVFDKRMFLNHFLYVEVTKRRHGQLTSALGRWKWKWKLTKAKSIRSKICQKFNYMRANVPNFCCPLIASNVVNSLLVNIQSIGLSSCSRSSECFNYVVAIISVIFEVIFHKLFHKLSPVTLSNLLLVLLSAARLRTLLLVAGIEPNPGPATRDIVTITVQCLPTSLSILFGLQILLLSAWVEPNPGPPGLSFESLPGSFHSHIAKLPCFNGLQESLQANEKLKLGL